MMRLLISLFGMMISFLLNAQVEVLKRMPLRCSEPSDIVSSPDGKSYYVLADKYRICEYSASGEIVSTKDMQSLDVEGVCFAGNKAFISEETLQRIHVMDATTMTELYTIPLHHGGGRNQGVEAITWIATDQTFLMSTEKNPQFFMEFDTSMNLQKTFQIDGIGEVSAMTYSEGHVYVLSDEDATLYCLNEARNAIEKSWKLPVINPEGVCYKGDGVWIVVSDDAAQWVELKLMN